jgi:hypothetical protein
MLDVGELSEPNLIRLFCFILLKKLPDRAMLETGESLVELWHFYKDSPEVRHSIAATPTVAVTLGERYTRPEFRASEE